MLRYRLEQIFPWGLYLCALISSVLLCFIVVFLIDEAGSAFIDIGLINFATDRQWNPGEGQYGLSPMLLATILLTLGAVLLATPVAVLSAIFCRFYAKPLMGQVYRRMVELMAGIPSVVYGFWGLVVLVPFIGAFKPPGASLLAGAVILALMILPTITLLVEASLAGLPMHYQHSAEALGLSRWTMVSRVLLPSARHGVVAAMLLGVARAIGETMAVLMVCGNIVQVPGSVFDPVRALTANIALEMGYAMDNHRSSLFVCGLVLLVLAMLVVNFMSKIDRRASYA